jgi:hypothetical protein
MQKSGGLWFKADSGKQFKRPYLKSSSYKRAGGVAQSAAPEFKLQYEKQSRP